MGVEDAATWFMEAWGGDNGTWMNGCLLPGCVLHNNALEASLKWLKKYSCSKGGRKASIQFFTLAMMRHMVEQSKTTEDCMRKAGHPNEFPSEPQISRSTWKAVQEIQPEHLKHL